MTGDRKLLSDFVNLNGSYVSFAGSKGGRISGQGDVVGGNLTLKNVNYVEELSHNLMSVSQICDKGNFVLFTDKAALILKPGFVIPDSWVLVTAPRKKDIYGLTLGVSDANKEVCLLSKASESDSLLWDIFISER